MSVDSFFAPGFLIIFWIKKNCLLTFNVSRQFFEPGFYDISLLDYQTLHLKKVSTDIVISHYVNVKEVSTDIAFFVYVREVSTDIALFWLCQGSVYWHGYFCLYQGTVILSY